MKLNFSLALSAVALLAACGGSGASNSGNYSDLLDLDMDDKRTVGVFSDNSGIIRNKTTADGVTVTNVVFAPNYRTYNIETGILPVDTNATGVEIVSVSDGFTQYGEYGRVNYRYNGSLNNILVYFSDYEDVGVTIVEGPLAHAGSSFGAELTSIPNGAFTYRGDVFTKSRNSSGVEEGTFSLTANFVSRTANVEAQTATTQLSGTNLLISNTGEISGRDLTMTVLGQTSTSAGLEGNFHGQSASGVSAVYYNSTSNPTHIGVLAGTR